MGRVAKLNHELQYSEKNQAVDYRDTGTLDSRLAPYPTKWSI